MSNSYNRPVLGTLVERLREPRRRIQVLAGPRQTGKTTLALQARERLQPEIPVHYASADDPGLRDRAWLEAQWEIGRGLARESKTGAVLALDEIQKLPRWSETAKRLWDADTVSGGETTPRVVLLGSSPLLVGRGLTESLAGRFETIRIAHWSFKEMRDAFGWDLDRYIYFGGYPGAAELVEDESRWRSYLLDALIETTISRDVLLTERVEKPALLRRLFELGCRYSGQILSYTKMLGQLDDAGNTTTLAHYLELLSGAGMLTGLGKYSGSAVQRRRSSPKLCALNTALISAQSGRSFADTRGDGASWGRLVESAVGAHLINTAEPGTAVTYWRDRGREVDFVVSRGDRLTAIEVKAGARQTSLPGLAAFIDRNPGAKPLIVGGDGIPVEVFLATFPVTTG